MRLFLAPFLLFSTIPQLVFGQTPVLHQQVVASSGAHVGGTGYNLLFTLGEGVIGRGFAPSSRLTAGFWHPGLPPVSGVDPLPPPVSPPSDGPVRLASLSAAPNPFSSFARVSYALESSGATDIRVTAKVFDVSGRLVRTVDESVKPTGQHTLIWNGRTDAGLSARGGVYFLTLTAGPAQKTIRLVLTP